MKTFTWLTFLLSQILISQECLIDSKDMFSVGSSEIINGEKLTLFSCDDGHQMWLVNHEEINHPDIKNHSTIEKEIFEQNIDVSISDKLLFSENVINKIEPLNDDKPVAAVKTETLIKKASVIQSNKNNYSSSLNIQKFGVETLLHKKIESDRLYNESLNNEKEELLYMMLIQKRLFEQKENNNSYNIFHNPIKFAYYSALIFITLSLI